MTHGGSSIESPLSIQADPAASAFGLPVIQGSALFDGWATQSVSSGVPRCLTPIPYRTHQDPFVPARSALEGALFEARSLRRDACNPHVFAAYRTRTACDWKLGLDGGLRCVHGYYPHVLPHQNIALRSEGKSVQYCAFELTV